jgi:transposase
VGNLRAVFNAIFYLPRSGCPWRLLPREFPLAGYKRHGQLSVGSDREWPIGQDEFQGLNAVFDRLQSSIRLEQIEEDIQRLRDRLKRASSRSSLIFLSGMASGLLRQEEDTGNNESRQNGGGTVAAERKAAMINRLVQQIAQGGTERTREDKSGPEEQSPRNLRKEVSGGY